MKTIKAALQQIVAEQVISPPLFSVNESVVYLQDGEGRSVRDVPMDDEIQKIPAGTFGKVFSIDVDDLMNGPDQHMYTIRALVGGKVYEEIVWDEQVPGYIESAGEKFGSTRIARDWRGTFPIRDILDPYLQGDIDVEDLSTEEFDAVIKQVVTLMNSWQAPDGIQLHGFKRAQELFEIASDSADMDYALDALYEWGDSQSIFIGGGGLEPHERTREPLPPNNDLGTSTASEYEEPTYPDDDARKPELDIALGDLVDFGPYGQLYVVNFIDDETFWVTDNIDWRTDPHAPGWSIKRYNAEKVLNRAGEDLEEDDEFDSDQGLHGDDY